MKRRLRLMGLALLLPLGLPGALAAIEKASAQAVHERRTSDSDQVSMKPVFLFDMRGRKDPFVAYPLMTTTARVGPLDIRQLGFGGMLVVHNTPVALFTFQGKNYLLKAGRLYGPDGMLVDGVRGRVYSRDKNEQQALLQQGEQRLTFSDRRISKRLDVQNNHD